MALWGGRFAQGPTGSVFALSRSVHFDWRLAPYDLRSSMAHLAILKKSELIAAKDADAINAALKELATQVADGSFAPIETDEDVHSALERGLTAKLGLVGGALRAGRSRNDQVTTDLRLFAIDHMLEVAALITDLNSAILKKASEYVNDSAPGFTHIQHAQPVSFGHELAKHAHAFARDLDRINDWFKRTSVSSLGAGALAGSSLPLDPARTAEDRDSLGPARQASPAVHAAGTRPQRIFQFDITRRALACHQRLGDLVSGVSCRTRHAAAHRRFG